MEIWKPVKDYEGLYEVSSLGRVKSLSRKIRSNNGYYISKEKVLVTPINKHGYCRVNLSKKLIIKTHRVHQLVAICFLNHKPDGTQNLVIDHINGDKLDNRVENLQLITQRENSSKDIKSRSSKYIGVSWYKKSNKWKSQIFIDNKKLHLGYFNCELAAHLAYQNKLKKLF